jgi:surface polysaccharide O-acyltransferase-like enzyme
MLHAKRKLYLEFLRVIAICLVVFNHTVAYHFPFNYEEGVHLTSFLHLFISLSDKVAVPLFFMISGALLLNRDESMKDLLLKRVLRFILVIGLFQITQYCWELIISNASFHWKTFFSHCFYGGTGSGAWAVWFLYAYLGFLLMLPFLRMIAPKLEMKHVLYLIVLQFLIEGIVPFNGFALTKWVPLINRVYLYIIIGYFLEHKLDIRCVTKKHLFRLGLISLGCILAGCSINTIGALLYEKNHFSQSVPCYFSWITIPSITIYLFIKKYCLTRPFSTVMIRTSEVLGGACFTVMLTENIFRVIYGKLIPSYYTDYEISFLVTLLVTGSGLILGIVAKKIPGIRRLV